MLISFFIENIMASSSNENKDTTYIYVISLMKLKVKNLISRIISNQYTLASLKVVQ